MNSRKARSGRNLRRSGESEVGSGGIDAIQGCDKRGRWALMTNRYTMMRGSNRERHKSILLRFHEPPLRAPAKAGQP